MKHLKIEFTSKRSVKIEGRRAYKGRITVGKFQEGFYSRLDFWNIIQYKEQWNEGLARIKTYDSSCLIADISLEGEEIEMQIYYLYKVANKIFVRYQMYLPEVFKSLKSKPLPFDPLNKKKRYSKLPKFRFKDEDGNDLEVWEADLDGIVIE